MMEGLTIDDEGKLIANLREPISPSCTTRSKGYLWFDPLASKTGEGEPDRCLNQDLFCPLSCGPIVSFGIRFAMQNLWVPRLAEPIIQVEIPFYDLCGSVTYRLLTAP